MNIISGSYQINQVSEGRANEGQKTPLAQDTVRLDSTDTKETSQKETVNTDDIETVVESLNEFIEPIKTNLKFELHEQLNEYYVTVVDPNTKEVIKEIPPKKMLDMYAAMVEHMGLLVDKKI